MYETDLNGSRTEVVFRATDTQPLSSATDVAPPDQGSNKGMLFLALGVTAVIIGLSGFLLYRHMKKENKVGYRLV